MVACGMIAKEMGAKKLDSSTFEHTLAYEKALKERHPEIARKFDQLESETIINGVLALKVRNRTFGMWRMNQHWYFKHVGYAAFVGGKIVWEDTLKDMRRALA